MVVIVTDELTLEDVFAATESAEQRLGRTVSPTLYTAAEFHRSRKAKHPSRCPGSQRSAVRTPAADAARARHEPTKPMLDPTHKVTITP